MKRIFSLVLSLLIGISLCGCRKEQEDTRLKVVCTVFPQYDFVREIGGELVNAEMLLPFSVESHDFSFDSLTVADLKKIASCDLFIYIGGPSDKDWVGKLKKSVKSDRTEYLALIDATDVLNESLSESMEHDHEDHDHLETETIDEHIWTSPKRAIEIVDFICAKLCELDKQNSEAYLNNANNYKQRLIGADNKLSKIESSGKKLIFADRFAFRYLCHDYGFSYDAAFPGCSSATDPSVSQIASLTKSAKDSKAKSIFYLENSDPAFAKNIANAIGAKAVMLHSAHTVSKKEFENKISFISILENNILKISEALKEQ